MANSKRPRSTSRNTKSAKSRPPGGYRKGPSPRAGSGRSGLRQGQHRGEDLSESYYKVPTSGRYRDEGSFSRRSNTRSQSRKQKFGLSLGSWHELWQYALQTMQITIYHMAFGLLWGAISAGIGFWFTFWSPFAQPIEELCEMLNEANLPLNMVLKPEILVFAIAGMGITYSLMHACGSDLRKPYQYSNLVAGVSATLAWFIAQWILSDSLAQNIAQFTAILSLGVIISLGVYDFVYICVMLLGTYVTFLVVIHYQYWEPGALREVFNPTVSITASSSAFAAMIIFFSLVGLTLGFWNIVAQRAIVPFFQSFTSSAPS